MNYRTRRLSRALPWLLVTTVCTVAVAVSAGSARWVWAGVLLAAWLALHRWMLAPGAVPVLTYHSVSGSPDWLPWADGLSLSPHDFERHLEILEKLGCAVVSTHDLLNARRQGEALPQRAVVIHFDDGYLDNWVAAFPLLRARRFPATIFLSLDFLETGTEPRPNLDDVAAGRSEPTDLHWAGYLNQAEIAAMQADGLIDFQSHGVTHGRVRSGPNIVTRLTPGNWRRHVWVQWAQVSGSKAHWVDWAAPPFVALGGDVPESRSALSGPEWRPDESESTAAFEERARSELERSRAELEANLGQPVDVFCWPFGQAIGRGRELASEAGYAATTGGGGENRPGEPPTVISRIHAGDRAAGWKWRWLDDFTFRGTVRLGQGNYYWYLPLAPIYLSRKWVLRLRRHFEANAG